MIDLDPIGEAELGPRPPRPCRHASIDEIDAYVDGCHVYRCADDCRRFFIFDSATLVDAFDRLDGVFRHARAEVNAIDITEGDT